jgi:cytochrome P450
MLDSSLIHKQTDMYIQTLQATMQGSGIGVELPLARYIGKWIPTDTCRQFFTSGPFLMKYGTEAIRGSKDRGDTTNIFAKIISEGDKGEGLDESDVVHEATALIVAGSDTTGNSLTYLVWAVLSRPELRKALEEELAYLSDDYRDEHLEQLALLNAVIDETLRLYGAAPGGLPREVPSEGAMIGGYFMPGGTTVTTQAYTIHLDNQAFPRAPEFDPSRWLSEGTGMPASEDSLAKSAYHPFGAGSRVCLGVHLAKMELRLAAAEFFRRCKGATLASTTTAQSMEMENFFLITPKSHKCEIFI